MRPFTLLIALTLLTLPAFSAEKPKAYNVTDGTLSEWDQRVVEHLGSSYEIEHFTAADHAYTEPTVVEGSAPDPLYVLEDGKPKPAEGVIHMYFVIEADGSVQTAIPVRQSGCECLEAYLRDAIMAFRFSPATLDGEAVATTALQFFEFKDKPESEATQP